MNNVSVRLFGLFQAVCGGVTLLGLGLLMPQTLGSTVASIIGVLLVFPLLALGLFAGIVGTLECFDGVPRFAPKERLSFLGTVICTGFGAGVVIAFLLLLPVLIPGTAVQSAPDYFFPVGIPW